MSEGVEFGKVGHKLGRFFYQTAVFFQQGVFFFRKGGIERLGRTGPACLLTAVNAGFLGSEMEWMATPVQQLCQINQMRLLPNQIAAYVGGGFGCTGVGHFHPSDSLESLSAGNGFSFVFSFQIPGQRTVEKFWSAP